MKKLRLFAFSVILLAVCSSFSLAQNKNVRIDIMYFHATVRCHGCLTIEENIKTSVNTMYAKELKDSTITLKSLDFFQKENEHFQDDYKFDTQALIISKKVDGREVKWKNLEKIWDFSNDFDKFRKYIEEEVKKLKSES